MLRPETRATGSPAPGEIDLSTGSRCRSAVGSHGTFFGSSFGTPVCGDTCEEEQVEHPQVVFLQLQPMAPISYLRFIYATWQCDSRSVCHPTVSDIYGIFSAPLPCCRKRLAPDYNQIHYCDQFVELRPAATCEPITAHRRGTDTGHSQNALAGSRNAGCELAHHSSSMAG